MPAAAVAVTAYGMRQQRKAASSQKKALGRAADAQLDATDRQISYLERADRQASQRLAPYENLGRRTINEYEMFLSPEGQYEYLQSNPIFHAAIDNANSQILTAAAPTGKTNSGGTVDQLFKNYLATGETFIGNQFNRLYNTVGLGESAAARTAANSLNSATNISGILGNQGDIASSAMINRANINNANRQNQFGMVAGGLLGSGLLGGAGIAGGGLTGAGLGALMFCDERLKENIERVGETDDGIPLYKFNYKGDDQVFFGPMAQEVEQVKPWAVLTDMSGVKMVNSEAI